MRLILILLIFFSQTTFAQAKRENLKFTLLDIYNLLLGSKESAFECLSNRHYSFTTADDNETRYLLYTLEGDCMYPNTIVKNTANRSIKMMFAYTWTMKYYKAGLAPYLLSSNLDQSGMLTSYYMTKSMNIVCVEKQEQCGYYYELTAKLK